MNDAYNVKKFSVGVITVLSLTTATSNFFSQSITSGISTPYIYESAYAISDNQGNVCMSSELSNKSVGDILLQKVDLLSTKHKSISVNLKITKITSHVSNFDFDDEYEEL